MFLEDTRCKIETWCIRYNQRYPPFCTGLDDAIRVCLEVGLLAEHEAGYS